MTPLPPPPEHALFRFFFPFPGRNKTNATVTLATTQGCRGRPPGVAAVPPPVEGAAAPEDGARGRQGRLLSVLHAGLQGKLRARV